MDGELSSGAFARMLQETTGRDLADMQIQHYATKLSPM